MYSWGLSLSLRYRLQFQPPNCKVMEIPFLRREHPHVPEREEEVKREGNGRRIRMPIIILKEFLNLNLKDARHVNSCIQQYKLLTLQKHVFST